ncbi:MarR family winged helix-turn-helix transcriptional regulator [Saccharopolyspora taberi]|uniref:HTH marR-type domain-containing protein n=1 Tax=Saccharopolyspora taberi TaxID=60895 RepID=A0ABN3VBS9_9PSEU
MNRADGGPEARGGAAFLLAQLGAHAAGRFAERLAGLDLTPAQAGLLRHLAQNPGRSQRELADDLGMLPSRFVPFVDELEERGLIERRKNPRDRRLYALHLTPQGLDLLTALLDVAADHEQQICQALTRAEHQQLSALLRRIADQHELSPGIHPGYRWSQPRRSRGGAPTSRADGAG